MDRAILPASGAEKIAPLADVRATRGPLCSENPVELLEREAGERIVAVDENRQVRRLPLRAETRIGDFDLEGPVVMHPLERHALHGYAHFTGHEGEIRHSGVDTREC